MLKVRLCCVGRLKEPFYRAAADEYGKRLSRYVKLEEREVKDEKAPEKLSDAEAAAVKRREGEALLEALPRGCYAVAMDPKGKRVSSEDFAKLLQSLAMERSEIVFFIGGSLGLHENVLARADLALSLSDLTFCHQLARVVLLEQLYRGCKIGAGEVYHK